MDPSIPTWLNSKVDSNDALAKPVQNIPLSLVIDLDQVEGQRLPHPRQVQVLGRELPMLLGVDAPYFAAAVLQLLRHGRNA